MEAFIKTIVSPLPYHMGSVNCYLIQTGSGYLLIDTGSRNQRASIENEIVSMGCQRGNLMIGDGDDLSGYGFSAQVISIPGHSKGSIGIILTEEDPTGCTRKSFFCGDLLENTKQPAFNSIMDDMPAVKESVQKLVCLKIDRLYPGHGKPFTIDAFLENSASKQ